MQLTDKRGDEEVLVFWQNQLFEEKERGVRSEYDSKLQWLGIREGKDYLLLMVPTGPIIKGFLQGDYWGSASTTPTTNWILYAGTQSYPYMRLTNNLVTQLVGEDYQLTRSLNISWWGWLSVGLSKLLIFLYGFTHSYGLAIILLTLIIYGALSPLTFKQFESMRKMSLVQPEIKKLQQKYKKEPQKLQAEIMAVYRKYKVNPMSGCLPMVVQLPIIFVLYRALLGFPFAESPSFLWIPNLGDPNIPLLLGLAGGMFLQQRISQKLQVVSEEQQGMQKIMQFFPLFLILILWSLPSGVMLYWFTSTLISIVQQLFISRRPVSLSLEKK